MLVNLTDILAIAAQRSMAVAAFNAPSFEAARATIDAAEATGYPVILQHAQVHEAIMPLDAIGPVLVDMAERSRALVCVHLDHGTDLAYIRRALEMGFTGAMFDGSTLPYEQNAADSRRAKAMCAGFDAGLECEIGSMGAGEGGANPGAVSIYTDPEEAARFVADTGCDALACSFGTVHGFYKGEPKLSLDVLEKIRANVDVPLVMHGGSGVSDEDYRRVIEAGIRKINYYTYGSAFAGEAAAQVIASKRAADPDAAIYWDDLHQAAYKRLEKEMEHVIKTFANGAEPV